MASLANVEHRNQEATCYVGNLDPQVSEDLLVELFTQIGRVNSVHMPKDKLSGLHSGYGFVEFLDVTDADYAIQILSMVKIFSRPMRVSKSRCVLSRSALETDSNPARPPAVSLLLSAVLFLRFCGFRVFVCALTLCFEQSS